MEQKLKKVNKIRSIREILDLNNDGKVSEEEFKDGVESQIIDSQGDLLSPMQNLFMRNQNLSIGQSIYYDAQPIKIKRKKIKTLGKTLNESLKTQVDLVQQSVAGFREYEGYFNTFF